MKRAVTVAIALGVVLPHGSAHAVPPASAPHAPPTTRADSRAGFVSLTGALPKYVQYAASAFSMGSTALDMQRAKELCNRYDADRRQCAALDMMLRAEGLAHTVSVDAFRLDRTEVSVADYDACVRVGACALPAYTPGDRRYDRPNFPVTHVTWNDAQKYCEHVGGRLPTEAEWERAARGVNGRDFPWGEVLQPNACNHGTLASFNFELDDSDGFLGLAPVGAMRDCRTPEGVMDLAGNVAEWVLDTYQTDDTGLGYTSKPATNPAGSPTGAYHVVKGGSYTMGVTFLRAAARTTITTPHAVDVGFRCAYSHARLVFADLPPAAGP